MIHEAFVYTSEDEFVGFLRPFLREGIAEGQPTMVVTTAERNGLLRTALGAEAPQVAFFDADEWYRRPGHALVAWSQALEESFSHDPELVRVVGEIQFGGDPGCIARWARYESLFNRSFAGRPAWAVCAYDARRLPKGVLADCLRTHPVIVVNEERRPSPEHFALPELGALLAPVADIDAEVLSEVTVADESDVRAIRPAIIWPAHHAGLRAPITEDLVLAVGELVHAALQAGPVVVRTARADRAWFSEVVSASEGTRVEPASLPITIGRVICDRVELAHDGGSVVRFVFATPPPGPRERILEAAAELFGRDGVQATRIDAIVARAGVAKATLYKHFASKDELAASWLLAVADEWLSVVRAEVDARAQTAVEKLAVFFDVLAEWIEEDIARGCPLLNVAVAVRDPHHPGRHHRDRGAAAVTAYLRELVSKTDLVDPDALAAQLHLLAEGALIQAAATESSGPARVAATAAKQLRDAALA